MEKINPNDSACCVSVVQFSSCLWCVRLNRGCRNPMLLIEMLIYVYFFPKWYDVKRCLLFLYKCVMKLDYNCVRCVVFFLLVLLHTYSYFNHVNVNTFVYFLKYFILFSIISSFEMNGTLGLLCAVVLGQKKGGLPSSRRDWGAFIGGVVPLWWRSSVYPSVYVSTLTYGHEVWVRVGHIRIVYD